MSGCCFWKSSAANLAAIREPCPLESESGPLASVTTPILTTPLDISPARAANASATKPVKARPAIATLHALAKDFIPSPPPIDLSCGLYLARPVPGGCGIYADRAVNLRMQTARFAYEVSVWHCPLVARSGGFPNRLARPADQFFILVDRRWPADVIALHFVTGFLAQERKLVVGLHALGDDRQIEPARQSDDGAHDGRRLRVGHDARNERLVDLDLVERKSLEIGQRGVSRPKVVHRYPNTQRLQPSHDGQGARKIADQHIFRDFDLQPARRKASLEQDGVNQ